MLTWLDKYQNENNEYETIYICYVDLLKRGR